MDNVNATKPEIDDDIVITGVMRKTRKRIKTNAAIAGKKMYEYVDSIVPGGSHE